MILINDDDMVSMQYLLQKIMQNIQILQNVSTDMSVSHMLSSAEIPTEIVRMANAAVVIDNIYKKEEMTYTLVLAFYSEDGRILSVKKCDSKSISRDITQAKLLKNPPNFSKISPSYFQNEHFIIVFV